MIKKTVTQEVDVVVELDAGEVLDELSDEQIRDEYASRFGKIPDATHIYEHFRTTGDAPQCLRDFLYEATGRILP